MSRNGSGTYSLPSNSWNPSVNGVPATAADWQTLINDVASALTQSVSKDGQTPLTGNLAAGGNKLTGLSAGSAAGDSVRFEQLFSQGALTDIASAATTDIGAQLSTMLRVTGTTGITSFGANYNGPRFMIFAGVVTLTHSATLVLPGAANITTAANDALIAVPISGGWQVVAYTRSARLPALAGPLASSGITGAAASGANADITSLTALTAGGLPNNSVLTVDIADANITTAKIADANITAAKLSGAQTGSAPIYGIRAWCVFNGNTTGTNAPTASGNVSTVTRNGVGDYTINFTTAMPDTNFSVFGITSADGNAPVVSEYSTGSRTTSSVRIVVQNGVGGSLDRTLVNVQIVR